MNFVPLTRQERAEWRDMLAPLDSAHFSAAVQMLAFSSLALALCNVPAVCAIYLLYAVAFYYMLTHSVLAVFIIALPGLLLFSLSIGFMPIEQAFMLPTAYAALVLGTVGGTLALMHLQRKPRLCPALLAIPALAYLICFAITSNARLSLLALLPSLLACVLSYCILTCRPHTWSVLVLATAFGIIATACYLLYLGAVGFPEGNLIQALVQQIRELILRYFDTLLETAAAQGAALGLSPTDISNVAAVAGNLLPGIFVVSCLVPAYAIWRVLLRIMAEWHILPRIPIRLAGLTVSPYAAGIFVFCFFVSLFANIETVTVVGMVAENLSFMLQPALFLVGYASVFSKKSAPSCLTSVLAVALIGLLLLSPDIAVTCTAFLGAYHVLRANLATRKKGGE